MEHVTKQEISGSLGAIDSMIERSEKARGKFAPGTPQHTLQTNRINALCVAAALLKSEYEGDRPGEFTKEELEKAAAPIASLISKSEKARRKLTPGSWQHTMLGNNLKALDMASRLLKRVL